MKKYFFTTLLVACFIYSDSQGVKEIVDALTSINKEVIEKDCKDRTDAMIISNRGLNYFFANKIASYLSEEGNISLFKNYAVLNSADGELSVNWNFAKKSKEERISSMFTTGVKADIADGFSAIFSDDKFKNNIGASLRHTWFGRGITKFDTCIQVEALDGSILKPSAQKTLMNAKRSFIIHKLETELLNKEEDFESSLSKMTSAEVPRENLTAIKDKLKKEFYEELKKEYTKKFAEEEAKALAADSAYNLMTTHWTTISAFVPVTTQKFNVAPSFAANFGDEELYPWKISVSYNQIWESRRYGRFFSFFEAGAFLNNSVNTDLLEEIKLIDYKNRGGIDTVHFAELESEDSYLGNYKNFVTPQLKIQGVWFPRKWNLGFALSFEKSFGSYDPLNGKFGIPVRFNDKDDEPTVNFEFQLRATDLLESINSEKSIGSRLSFGLSVGLPFSSIIY